MPSAAVLVLVLVIVIVDGMKCGLRSRDTIGSHRLPRQHCVDQGTDGFGHRMGSSITSTSTAAPQSGISATLQQAAEHEHDNIVGQLSRLKAYDANEFKTPLRQSLFTSHGQRPWFTLEIKDAAESEATGRLPHAFSGFVKNAISLAKTQSKPLWFDMFFLGDLGVFARVDRFYDRYQVWTFRYGPTANVLTENIMNVHANEGPPVHRGEGRRRQTMEKEPENRNSAGVDRTLVAMFLRMTPEQRLQANDSAVRTILELRNAYRKRIISKHRPERHT